METAISQENFKAGPLIGLAILIMAIIAMILGAVSSNPPPPDPGEIERQACRLLDASIDMAHYVIVPQYQAGELVSFTVSSVEKLSSGISEASFTFTLKGVSPTLGGELASLADSGISIEKAWSAAGYNAGQTSIGESTRLLRAGDQYLKSNSTNHWRQFYSEAGEWNTYRNCFSSRVEKPPGSGASEFLGKIR